MLTLFFDYCAKILTEFFNSEVILLFKISDNTSVKSYRPIFPLSHLYKLFTNIITNRLALKLVEQAIFRKEYSKIQLNGKMDIIYLFTSPLTSKKLWTRLNHGQFLSPYKTQESSYTEIIKSI